MENFVENDKVLSLQEDSSPFDLNQKKSLLDVEGIDVPNLTTEDIVQIVRESRERPTIFDLVD